MTAAIAVFVSSLVVWFASQSRSVADCRKGQKGMPWGCVIPPPGFPMAAGEGEFTQPRAHIFLPSLQLTVEHRWGVPPGKFRRWLLGTNDGQINIPTFASVISNSSYFLIWNVLGTKKYPILYT